MQCNNLLGMEISFCFDKLKIKIKKLSEKQSRDFLVYIVNGEEKVARGKCRANCCVLRDILFARLFDFFLCDTLHARVTFNFLIFIVTS